MIAVSSSTIAAGLTSVVGASASGSSQPTVAAAAAPTPTPPPNADASSAGNSVAKAASKEVSPSTLNSQVRALQTKMDSLNPSLAFVVDQASGRLVIQLTDRHTKEVIQQYPSEAAIQISQALDRFDNGKLLNQTA